MWLKVEFCVGTTKFTFRLFCPLVIVIREIHRKDRFNKRKQEARMEKIVRENIKAELHFFLMLERIHFYSNYKKKEKEKS